ncbi:MAG: FAD binding domain-containing protein [Janthinobacterium lividum]
MRSNAGEYDLIAPASLENVLATMAAEQRIPMAGGTELMVALCAGRLPQRRFVSLQNLQALRFLDASDADTLRIGSGTTFTDLRRSNVIAEEFPLIAQTSSWTGSIANQNRGTLGGNIANASPAADTPPALLVYDAELELISSRGTRILPYRHFHLGYKRTALAADELIFAVRLPRRFAQHRQTVRKVGTRNAQAVSKIALACVAITENGVFGEIAIAAASLLDRPARLFATESALRGKEVAHPDTFQRAAQALASEVAPIDDIRSTGRYRARVAQNLLEDFLTHCADQPNAG